MIAIRARMGIFRAVPRLLLVLLLGAVALHLLACAPKVSRGGAGTKNPELDVAALSVRLDKADLDYLIDENMIEFLDSNFWKKEIVAVSGDKPLFTIFPIRNETSQHLENQMATLLSAIETYLVNSGEVRVISRERQAEMMREAGMQQAIDIDAATAARLGRQLGVQYYFTGKLSAVDEKLAGSRRVQYSLFLQVLDVETSLILFQNETARSKAIKK